MTVTKCNLNTIFAFCKHRKIHGGVVICLEDRPKRCPYAETSEFCELHPKKRKRRRG